MIRDRSSDGRARPPLAVGLGCLGAGVLALAACTSSAEPIAPATHATTWSVGTPGATTSPTAGSSGASSSGSTAGSASGAGATSGGGPTAGGGSGGQPSADATRDGVPASIAALPLSQRIHQVPPSGGGFSRAVTTDGIWMISRPQGAPATYSEILHLSSSGAIVRAYPLIGVPPQWLLTTPSAVYCGRRGDATSPDAMVCRIDRTTGDLIVRVSADRAAEPALTQQEVAGRSGVWTVVPTVYSADFGTAPTVGTYLVFSSARGVLQLDPDTLVPLGS